MKKLISSLLVLASFSTFAAEVVGARLDSGKQNILLDVRYGGGCRKHSFELKLGRCLESMPVQCEAELVHNVEGGFDPCESLRFQTVSLNLSKYGFDEDYFRRGTLTITGDKNSNGIVSEVTVRLP